MNARTRGGLLISVPLTVGGALLGLYVYRVLLVSYPPLSADEAGHALPAARMAFALREGSLPGFLEATRREVVWPFLHPWVITPFFLVFGVSAHVARLVSLVAFGAAVGLVPLLARELLKDAGGAAEAGRDLSSPPLLGWLSVAVIVAATPWDLVCTVMSEPLGMFLTLAALLVEARAARRGSTIGDVLGGLLVAAAFFTKYSYGLPLMAAVLLALAGRGRSERRRFFAALAGMAVPVAVWLAWILWPDPRRATELRAAVVNRDEGLQGWTDLLFYPRAIVSSVGWPAGLAALLMLATLLARGRLGRRLPAVLFVGVALAMLTLHPNKQERYLFAVVPVLLVLAETELASRLRRLRGREVLWPALAGIAIVAGSPLARAREAATEAAPARRRASDRRPRRGRGRRPAARAVPRDDRPPSAPRPDLGAARAPAAASRMSISCSFLAAKGPIEPTGAGTRRRWDPNTRRCWAMRWTGRYQSVVTLDLDETSPSCPSGLQSGTRGDRTTSASCRDRRAGRSTCSSRRGLSRGAGRTSVSSSVDRAPPAASPDTSVSANRSD